MAQESLVIFIYVILEHGIGLGRLCTHHLLEAGDDLLQKRFVEDILAPVHDQHHIVTFKQIACLEDDTIGSCRENFHPEALVEHFAREDKDTH